MYHSIIFEKQENGKTVKKNTWADWRLIPTSRPFVSMPSINEKYVDIPGRSGTLDLSNYLTGGLTYSDRTGSFTFYVHPDYIKNWESIRTQIAQFLNGSVIKMTLEDDINNYYEGRIMFKDWNSGNFSQVTIDYHVGPYKYSASNRNKVSL